MLQALNDQAFSPYLTPEGLWRAGCAWTASGEGEQGEWLHEIAVDLIEIHELPTCDEPLVQNSALERLQAYTRPRYEIHEPNDIPF